MFLYFPSFLYSVSLHSEGTNRRGKSDSDGPVMANAGMVSVVVDNGSGQSSCFTESNTVAGISGSTQTSIVTKTGSNQGV